MRLVLIITLLISASCFGQKKPEQTNTNTIVINNESSIIKFQTSQAKLETNPINGLIYYWTKSNEIHTTKGGYDGALLNGAYSISYLSKQLKEKGTFDKGLKSGEWKSWYENGEIDVISNYKKGVLHGEYKKYNEKGEVTLEAEYKNGLLNGETKCYSNGKLLKTTAYKNGEEVVPEKKTEGDSTKSKKPNFFKQKAKQEEATPNQ
jgi:antitoxin component YwqK of YwqJK toxin-antitoxin module